MKEKSFSIDKSIILNLNLESYSTISIIFKILICLAYKEVKIVVKYVIYEIELQIRYL